MLAHTIRNLFTYLFWLASGHVLGNFAQCFVGSLC